MTKSEQRTHGRKGGFARAQKMTAAARSASAKKAARALWKKIRAGGLADPQPQPERAA